MLNHLLTFAIFLLIGIEIRDGLSHIRAALLPTIGALGGMLVPALFFVALSSENQGWAIVMPTDVALALGALSLLGSRIRPEVKVFLMTLAVADDFFSLLVMVIFFRDDLDLASTAYTLGAALLGSLIPFRTMILKALAPIVSFVVVPLYIWINLLSQLEFDSLTTSESLIITASRFFGKVIGISLASYLALRFMKVKMPVNIDFNHIIGVGLLSGMGATVSLVIAEITIDGEQALSAVRSGLFLSALLSGLAGILWLKRFPASQ